MHTICQGVRSTAVDDDLGALFARITRRLIEAERPLLAAHGLTMWGYIALGRLSLGPSETQHALATAIGHDKTRLIGVLDELESTGLIARDRDPSDRRARLVSITSAGRERLAAAVADIRAMEDDMLADLADGERETLRAALRRLTR
jgi:DNA-binding MarR family transcriptional regulator